MIEIAKKYIRAGLCCLPAIKDQKRPAVASWRQYQERMPTEAEVTAWFWGRSDGICIVCGSISGNMEIIDFDFGGELFNAWWESLPEPLRQKLVIERTQSGGLHVIYRCETAVCGNMKLAQRRTGEKIVTLIETRGEGGLFLCAPTPGYELIQGDLANPPVVTAGEREILLGAGWDLNELKAAPVSSPVHTEPASITLRDEQSRPGDDFNARGDVRSLLKEHGWTLIRTGENEYWRRPGKNKGWSATLKDNVFYVHSSNAGPFEPGKGYSPFAVYATIACGGDFDRAASSLRMAGFGSNAHDCNADVDISALTGEAQTQEEDDAPVPLTQLIADFKGLNPPVIHGLLREGETMNIIASPKVGKSWLVGSLATCIASGMDWLDFKTEQGKVLLVDNELHTSTLTSRYMQIAEAMGVKPSLFGNNLHIKTLRGKLKDLHALGRFFEKIEPETYKVVIIDAFYRTLPVGTDENDNGQIANLYNLLDNLAGRINCSFILIHHASKGNQATKSVTDVGAGAGSQSRAADSHLILRPHEDDDTIVLDAEVRSFRPIEPLVLRREHPLFVPDQMADPTALKGAVKPKERKGELTVEQFVDQCIATHDPCSQRSIVYEARQLHDLSERKAREMIDLAMEQQLVLRIRVGPSMKYVAIREGVSGDKGLLIAARLIHYPGLSASEIAAEFDVSQRYVNSVKREIEGVNHGN